ncbi:hypothetical protein BpHYR1_016832 [Brachionus plicatilis]|uniref:Uncharacterized protein n=1 Tax=Brachionus plicatilis TaxID=10195 RepID=A0A3M7PES4_BRAPC|nr:hypothetical protein BpHYR1_016832 [Brachionus plicatilis]
MPMPCPPPMPPPMPMPCPPPMPMPCPPPMPMPMPCPPIMPPPFPMPFPPSLPPPMPSFMMPQMSNGSFPPMFQQMPALPPPVFQPPFTQVAPPPPPPSFTLPPQPTLTQNLNQGNVFRAQPVPNMNQLPCCPPNFYPQPQQQQFRPFCPPGCVPAPQKCPPGCVPNSSRAKNQSFTNYPEFGRNSHWKPNSVLVVQYRNRMSDENRSKLFQFLELFNQPKKQNEFNI